MLYMELHGITGNLISGENCPERVTRVSAVATTKLLVATADCQTQNKFEIEE